MPKVILQGSIEGFQGQIGNLIFRRMPDGSTVVSAAPPKLTGRRKKRAKERRSSGQKAHNKRFSHSSSYASWASKQIPVYSELAAADPMRNAYNFAISDWFNPPVIHRVERRKGYIQVEATDNIQVARVRVTIQDEEGNVIEKGEAVRSRGNWWKFATQTKGHTIVAEAWDLPKNVAKFVLQ